MHTKANIGGPQDAEVVGSLPNPVYTVDKPHLRAEVIYFYYLKITGDPKEETKVFVIERGYVSPDNMQTEIPKILEEIRSGVLKPCGWRIGDVRWRRKSYIVVVLEDQHHKLAKDNAVVFSPDYAFRDGRDTLPFPAPYEKISGFFCFNHMRHHDGHDLGDKEPDPITVKVNHPHRAGQSQSRPRGHDDSATNLGPPVSPP